MHSKILCLSRVIHSRQNNPVVRPFLRLHSCGPKRMIRSSPERSPSQDARMNNIWSFKRRKKERERDSNLIKISWEYWWIYVISCVAVGTSPVSASVTLFPSVRIGRKDYGGLKRTFCCRFQPLSLFQAEPNWVRCTLSKWTMLGHIEND